MAETSKKPVVLFISRRFPPSKGGMERFAADLSLALTKDIRVMKVVWTKQNRWLSVAALPILFVQALVKLASESSISVIHSQDALTAPLAWLLGTVSGKPYVTVIHGLDITYKNILYQKAILPFVRRAHLVIANSSATATAAAAKNIHNVRIIPPGFWQPPVTTKTRTRELELKKQNLGYLNDKRVLLTVGRLVKRKGVEWFISNVMPGIVKANPDVCYVVVGKGPMQLVIEQTIKVHQLEDHVHMLGEIDEATKNTLYKFSDIFVMPNIPVSGDMEGFGIVAGEAALAGLPVVASELEGITDAVRNDRNGKLVEPCNASAYHQAISALLDSPEDRRTFGKKARAYMLEYFAWERIAGRFIDSYNSLAKAKTKPRRSLKARLVVPVLVLTLAIVFYYVYKNPHIFDSLARVSPLLVVSVIIGYGIIFIGLAAVLHYSVRLYDKKISLNETIQLNAYSSLTNFFGPGQSGSGIRAIYLKVKLGLKIKSFIFASLIYYAFYSVLSVIMLLAGAGRWWQATLAAVLAITLSVFILKLHHRRGEGQGIMRPKAVLGILLGTIIQVFMLAVIYYLEVKTVQPGVSIGQAISFTGAANLALFVAITPGAIGIREAFLLLSQSLHHVPSSTIVAAGVIDRAIYIVYLGILFVAISFMHGKKQLDKFRDSQTKN